MKAYNPLNKKNLGQSVARALLQEDISSLPPPRFEGAGVYLIYYVGEFNTYQRISEMNREGRYSQPIYIGKAVPKGARKGGYGLGESPGQVLFNRLREHAESIRSAENLDLSDFHCRFLVIDDIWIPLAESLLIEMFNPLWNREIDGFGNHDPGSGRYNQQRSLWDVLHPGRSWAYKLPSARKNEEVGEKAQQYLSAIPQGTQD